MKEEMVMMKLSEKKESTQDVDKGTDELEAMTLMEKKYSTNDFDKGTDELADTKQTAVKIRRKCIYQFEGQYKGSKGWFKLDSGVLKPYLLQFIQNSINTLKNNRDC